MDFMKLNCEDFIEVLASKEPVPGGGGAAAYVAAIGMALGNMVGSLTIGKKKYADVQDDIIKLTGKANKIQSELLALVQADAKVFAPLAKAYGMPANTMLDQMEKERVLDAAMKKACSVPFDIMRKCCEAIDLHQEFANKGTLIAISDVGCGVACCKAALMAASLNVFINTKAMPDKAYASETNEKTEQMLNIYTAMADKIYEQVMVKLK